MNIEKNTREHDLIVNALEGKVEQIEMRLATENKRKRPNSTIINCFEFQLEEVASLIAKFKAE